MTYTITFLDYMHSFTDEIEKQIKNVRLNRPIKFMCAKGERVQAYRPTGKRVFYVSPANSYGTLDGGIDYFYGQMFPKLQRKLQKIIQKINHRNVSDLPYLPIGSAVIVPTTEDDPKKFLISAPTMWLPQRVKKTKNAYYAFYAVLAALESFGIQNHDEIIVPGLCTGCGGFTSKHSVKQIINAFNDFYHNKSIPNIITVNGGLFLAEPNKDEQPKYDENREFIEISDSELHQPKFKMRQNYLYILNACLK